MLFMGLFQVMEFHCLSGALATGSTYIFSALWFFPLNCTNLYIWASALETFCSAFILQFKSFMKGRIKNIFFQASWGEKAKGAEIVGNKTWFSQIVNQCLSTALVYLGWLVLADEEIQNSPSSPPPPVAAPTNLYLNPYLSVAFLGDWGCDVEEFLSALWLFCTVTCWDSKWPL